MDNKLTNEIRALISQIAKEEIKKMSPNMEYVYDGIVEKDADDNLCVNVKGQLYKIGDEVMNYSRTTTFLEGQTVRVYAKGDKMNNAYIGVVWKKESVN